MMDAWIKLHYQSAGKDKLARLLQYLSRFLWYYFENRKKFREAVLRLKILENALSSFRKYLRFGKSAEVLYGALNTLHLSDPVLRVLTTFSRIQQSLFLFYDHLICLSRSGLFNLDKTKFVQYSCKFWLGSILINLLRDLYEINLILQSKTKKALHSLPCKFQTYPLLSTISQRVPHSKLMLASIENHPDVFCDTVKNFCDLWIPLNALGTTKLSPGFIGFLGSISSLAGLAGIVNPRLKLVPS